MSETETRLRAPEMTEGSVEDHAEEWLVYIYSGVASENDLARFRLWLGENPLHASTYRRAEQQWRDLILNVAYTDARQNPDEEKDEDTGIIVPLDFSGKPRRNASGLTSRPRQNLFRLAAGLAAVFVAAFLGFLATGRSDTAHYVTGTGEIQTVTLADGSEITLGGDSELKTAFSKHRRNLELVSGGAFFKVEPDTSRPFRVRTNDVAVTVVGTSFDVRKNPEDVRVSVASGHVRVGPVHKLLLPGNNKDEISLKAGDQVTLSNAGVAGKVTTFDPEVTFGWSQGYLIYKDEKLSDVIAEVNRYRRDKIRLADPSLGGKSVSFIMPADNTDLLLSVLVRSEGLKVERTPSEVVLSKGR